jgi:hypothetical protein
MLQGTQEFVLVERESSGVNKVFEKVNVITGAKDQDYVELKFFDGINPNDKIVTNGAFYMLNALRGGGD